MGLNTNDASAMPSNFTTQAEAGVKYRLVEAEEVDPQPKAQVASSKKKGKTNWTQFPLNDTHEEEHNARRGGAHGFRGGRGRGRGYGGRGRGGRRPYYDGSGTYYNGVYVPNQDPTISAQWAKTQIEFYFTPDNLVRDVFLRQHMDVDGYVPLAFVGSFQAVYAMHQDYPSLLEAMKSSEIVELDEENEKIRLRNGWQQWLWPNADGGYGVPRYLKVQQQEADEQEPEQEAAPDA